VPGGVVILWLREAGYGHKPIKIEKGRIQQKYKRKNLTMCTRKRPA